MKTTINTKDEVEKLKRQTELIRKKRLGVSRLDRFKGELLSLYRSDSTIAELQRWLRKKRVKVVYSTVYRWIQKNG